MNGEEVPLLVMEDDSNKATYERKLEKIELSECEKDAADGFIQVRETNKQSPPESPSLLETIPRKSPLEDHHETS